MQLGDLTAVLGKRCPSLRSAPAVPNPPTRSALAAAFGSAVTVAEAIGSFGASLGSIRREPKLISLEVFMKQENVMMQL